MRVSLKQFILSMFLVFVLVFQLACGLPARVAKAVGAIPAVVKIVVPNVSPTVTAVLESGVAAFKVFASNQTVSNWQKAQTLWNDSVKPALEKFNNSRLNLIIAAVDILIGQVEIPTMDFNDSPDKVKVKAKFNEADIKKLEELVKD